MSRSFPLHLVALASVALAVAVALALLGARLPVSPPGLYPDDVAPLQTSGDGCYRFQYRTFDRKECVFFVAVATRDYEVIDLPDLQARMWAAAGLRLRELGFDTLQVIAIWPRENLTGHFDRLDVHFVNAPAASIVDATEDIPSILDWPYEPVGVYGTYRSVVVTRADRPLSSLADLNGDTLAVVDQTSSSGYRVPRHYLKGQGIFPVWRFSQGSHGDVVDAVLRGDVRAGATHDGWPRYLDPDEAAQLVSMEIPFDIPGSTWLLRRDIAARSGVAVLLFDATRRWGVEANKMAPDSYWADLVPAPPTLIQNYDDFRAAERTLMTPTSPASP